MTKCFKIVTIPLHPYTFRKIREVNPHEKEVFSVLTKSQKQARQEFEQDLEKERKDHNDKIKDIESLISETKQLLTDEKSKMKKINEFLKAKSPNKEMIKTLVNKIEISEDKKVKIFFNFNINEG